MADLAEIADEVEWRLSGARPGDWVAVRRDGSVAIENGLNNVDVAVAFHPGTRPASRASIKARLARAVREEKLRPHP